MLHQLNALSEPRVLFLEVHYPPSPVGKFNFFCLQFQVFLCLLRLLCSMSVTLMSRLMLHLHKITSQGLYAWYGDTVARPADSYTPDGKSLDPMLKPSFIVTAAWFLLATMSLMDFGPKENHYSQESIDHSGDISEDTSGQSNSSGIPGPSTTNFEIMEVWEKGCYALYE